MLRPRRAPLLSLHRSVGLLIPVLMAFRVVWRLTHPPPPFPPGFPRLEAAALTHRLACRNRVLDRMVSLRRRGLSRLG